MEPVYVIDDDAGLRASMASLLKREGFDVHLFDSAAMFFNQMRDDLRGCVVLDIQLPGMNGLQVLEHLSKTEHQLAILVVTAFGDVPLAVRAMSLGAFDFIEKPFQPEDFVEKIRIGLDQSAEQSRKLEERRDVEAKFALLSGRERDVLQLLLTGMSNKQIAFKLNLSEKTISAHRTHILSKTGADSIVSLVHLIGLVGLDRDGINHLNDELSPESSRSAKV